jgi:hypothetical protein
MKRRSNVYTILIVLCFYSADYFRLCNDGDKGCAKGGVNQRGSA